MSANISQRKFLHYFLIIVVSLLQLVVQANFCRANTDRNQYINLLEQISNAFTTVIERARPAVVHILIKKTIKDKDDRGNNHNDLFNNPFFDDFFDSKSSSSNPFLSHQQKQEHGSGFIFQSNGYILTNNHVIKNAESITVQLLDGREFEAKIAGVDPPSDIGLLKIDADDLPVLELGDSDNLKVGEPAIAVGNPFMSGQTVTVGIISALKRHNIGISDYENFIQTDAAINRGNSGGPLLNIYGRVIGINTAFSSQNGVYSGIGFAIPINMAATVARQLQKHGEMVRGWIGVTIKNIDGELAKANELESNKGVQLITIENGSPAAIAHLMKDDIIVAINDLSVVDAIDFRNRISLTAPNTVLTFKLIRSGKLEEIPVKIFRKNKP